MVLRRPKRSVECSDSEKKMSACADQNHAPSLTCVRLECSFLQIWFLDFSAMVLFLFKSFQVERTWDLVRDSGQRKLTYSSQNHCTSTLRSGRRKTIVSQTMCAPAERLSQSEIVLPLRKTCYYSPLAEVGVFSTEIKSHFPVSLFLFRFVLFVVFFWFSLVYQKYFYRTPL